jgi:intracellular septation protein
MSKSPARRSKPKPRTEPQGGAKLLIDLGPLLVFFLTNFLAPVPAVARIFVATGAFIVAMIAAMLFSAIRYRRISPLLWFSGVMVVLLGGLTIWLHDETFIKMKPTVYYALVAGLLGFGLATGRPLLQNLLGSTYPGLDAAGWMKLTRNWAIFFVFMALVNEAVWRNSSTAFWVGFKLWGALPLTFLFAAANVPMLMRHGLMREDAAPVEPGPIE